jgi:2-polyprenyl-3-methyl-5-hydroxy-6-metoxy-1,4-benzoquinol methylase
MMAAAYIRGRRNLFKRPLSDGQIGSKEAEINYLRNKGIPEEQVIRKPFSFHDKLHEYLIDMGQIFSLLPPPPARVIDFGCGTGWTSEFYAQGGYQVTGLDISCDMIDIAQKYRKRGGKIDFITGDYEFCAFNQKYDAAVFYDCLHHALDETAALKCAYNALKEGGRLIVVEPGAGHGTTQQAMETHRKYGTTERPMPPQKTMPILRELGFKNIRALSKLKMLNNARQQNSAIRQLMVSIVSRVAYGVVVAEK